IRREPGCADSSVYIRRELSPADACTRHVLELATSLDIANTTGSRLGCRGTRWRGRAAGTEADYFNFQNEKARDLTTGELRPVCRHFGKCHSIVSIAVACAGKYALPAD